MYDSQGSVALVQRVASYGLPGVDPEPWSISTGDWPAFLAGIVGQRITGIAVAAAGDDWLRLGDGPIEQLETRHREAMLWALTLERTLLVVAAHFSNAEIPFVVLKGPALAHCYYPDPSWRGFADLDILVRRQDWRRACAAVEELGFTRNLPEPRTGFDERFGKAATHTGPSGAQIDLHLTLTLGPFGLWMDPDELFERKSTFGLGGVQLNRLDTTTAFLHACVHASLGWYPPLLAPLRDVAQVATTNSVDWTELHDLSNRWRLGVVIWDAVNTASERLGVNLPEPACVILATRPRRRDLRLLSAYASERRWRGGTSVSTLRAIKGAGAKFAYVRSMLVPSPEFVAARTGLTRAGTSSYLRRWKVPVGWLRGKQSQDEVTSHK